MANDLVQPKDAAAPAPAGADVVTPVSPQEAPPEAPAAPSAAQGAGAIPEDLLRIPAVAGLLSGEPAAVSAPLEEFAKRPEGQMIQQSAPALQAAGMGTYRSLGGDLGVLFNRFYISGEEIVEADKAGRLQEIAPPFDAVNQQISGMGQDQHPALKQGRKVPEGLKTAPVPNPPQIQSPVTAPAPSSEQEIRAQQARMKNLQPGAPTSGPRPGSGRLLNNIMKPVL